MRAPTERGVRAQRAAGVTAAPLRSRPAPAAPAPDRSAQPALLAPGEVLALGAPVGAPPAPAAIPGPAAAPVSSRPAANAADASAATQPVPGGDLWPPPPPPEPSPAKQVWPPSPAPPRVAPPPRFGPEDGVQPPREAPSSGSRAGPSASGRPTAAPTRERPPIAARSDSGSWLPAEPPTYYWQALACLLLFLPTAVVALVYSFQVTRLSRIGDFRGAMRSSRLARTWCLLSVLGFIVVFVLVANGVLNIGSSSGTGG